MRKRLRTCARDCARQPRIPGLLRNSADSGMDPRQQKRATGIRKAVSVDSGTK